MAFRPILLILRQPLGTCPYIDELPCHIHQFSPASADILMRRYGFYRCHCVFSLPYSWFGYLQSILNVMNSRHNFFYYLQKRHHVLPLRLWHKRMIIAYNFILLAVWALPSLACSVIDFLLPSRAGVLTLCYKRTTQ